MAAGSSSPTRSNGALTATLADSTVESDSAMFEGGGVGVQGAELTIERTTIIGNDVPE